MVQRVNTTNCFFIRSTACGIGIISTPDVSRIEAEAESTINIKTETKLQCNHQTVIFTEFN